MSVKIIDGQQSVIYPPMFGMDGGPCSETCSCFPCQQMRHDAAQKCPVCGVEIGYGGLVPIEVIPDVWQGRTWGVHGEIRLIHYDCYQAQKNAPIEAATHEAATALAQVIGSDEEIEGSIGGHDAADD